jgi:hypothetical protein
MGEGEARRGPYPRRGKRDAARRLQKAKQIRVPFCAELVDLYLDVNGSNAPRDSCSACRAARPTFCSLLGRDSAITQTRQLRDNEQQARLATHRKLLRLPRAIK